MHDLGPFNFVQYHEHKEAPDVRHVYRSSIREAAVGHLGDFVDGLEREGYVVHTEGYPFEALVLDCPDALDPEEARAVVQGALSRRVPLPFDHRRHGFAWAAVLERLDRYGLKAVAPSLNKAPKRGFLGLGGAV